MQNNKQIDFKNSLLSRALRRAVGLEGGVLIEIILLLNLSKQNIQVFRLYKKIDWKTKYDKTEFFE